MKAELQYFPYTHTLAVLHTLLFSNVDSHIEILFPVPFRSRREILHVRKASRERGKSARVCGANFEVSASCVTARFFAAPPTRYLFPRSWRILCLSLSLSFSLGKTTHNFEIPSYNFKSAIVRNASLSPRSTRTRLVDTHSTNQFDSVQS